MSYTLRPYQLDAVESALENFQVFDSLLDELPTGTGKTLVIAALLDRWEHGRCMVICPRRELVNQAAQKIYKFTGEKPAIEMGAERANETDWGRSRFIVASVDSLHEKRLKVEGRWQDIGLLVVDEAHHASKLNKSYQNIIEHLRALNPNLKLFGVTATARRHDRVAMGLTFEACGFQYPITSAIRDGWLVPLQAETVTIKSLDLSTAKVGKHDFSDSQLSKFMHEQGSLAEMAAAAFKHGAEHLKTLMFVPKVQDAKEIAAILRDTFGVKADWVCGDKKLCDDRRRDELISQFREGTLLTCLVNVAVFTEGFDEPTIKCVVNGRPTQSESLLTQIIGRGTRTLDGTVDGPDLDTPEKRRAAIAASDKPFCKIVDLVDSTNRVKLVTSTDILGGNYNPQVVERAKKKLADEARPRLIAEALQEADEELRLEAQKQQEREREAQEREREEYEKNFRRGINVSIETESHSVDLFDAYERRDSRVRPGRRAVMPFGKYKGKPVESLSTGSLKAYHEMKIKTKWVAEAISRELAKRSGDSATSQPRFERPASAPVPMAAGQCTPQQARVLAKHGHPTDVSQAEAARRIAQINRDLSRSRVGA